MVTTVTSPTDPLRRATAGEGYDGVVRVSVGGFYGTGVVLYGGFAVLTAAHLFAGKTASWSTASVAFETQQGLQTRTVSGVLLHPAYDTQSNNDLALVWLGQSAPTAAERYELYRGSDEVGQTLNLVGYGMTGTGNTGAVANTGDPVRLVASNRFDALGHELKSALGDAMGWSPAVNTQLLADFDNGLSVNDALGRLMWRSDTGLGSSEGMLAPGDSGGPAFVNGLIAGVGSYLASLSSRYQDPDVDNVDSNSSFGEIAAWQRVSAYQQWIDQSVRQQLAGAPTTPQEVQKSVVEGNWGTKLLYFLLTLNGLRSDPDAWLSVDYTTRDGTALAGQDYLPVSGTLVLYPDEDHAVIPVEVMSDGVAEPSEVFYLDVFNPVGAEFDGGAVKLTAMRTITDDDGWWF